MTFKINISNEVKLGAVLVMVLGLIAFTERMKGDIAVRDIRMKIENTNENHFVDEGDIMDLMQLDQSNIIGASVSGLSFKTIERKIQLDPFIRDAEVYCDLEGNLTVKVELRRPIARMVRRDGPDGYIADDGTVMPVSDKFTSRVLLLSGSYIPTMLRQENLHQDEWGSQLMALLARINNDAFWKAQIAELDIDQKGRLTMYTQVGDEKIEFGTPDDMDTKFRKLAIFYKEILPRVGWNKYDRVNLEYAGQIVAE